MRPAVLVLALAALLGQIVLSAQGAAPARRGPRLPEGVKSARDNKTAAEQWLWHMGMLRGVYEIDGVATLEIEKSTGTVRVAGQPCTLANYRASVNYQTSGMRVQYTCTRAGGQPYKAIEVVSGQFAWDEDIPWRRSRSGQRAPRRRAGGARRAIGSPVEQPAGSAQGRRSGRCECEGHDGRRKDGRDLSDSRCRRGDGSDADTGRRSRCRVTSHCAERIEVRQGNVLTEFIYSNYEDYNDPENKVDAFFPGHIVEKRDGVTVLDLTIGQTETGNVYVMMPVPDNVRRAAATRP